MNHPYSINLRERQGVYFCLAAIAFGASILLGKFITALSWTPPGWLDIPGAFTLFGLLCWWFDKQLWKLPVVRRLGISTPILEGQWSGTTRSSFDGFATGRPVTMVIHQNWRTISILLESDHSRSESTAAAISVGSETILVYYFVNHPKTGAPDGLHAHVGTASLRVHPRKLEGEYYSGRDRRNIGTVVVERTPHRQQ